VGVSGRSLLGQKFACTRLELAVSSLSTPCMPCLLCPAPDRSTPPQWLAWRQQQQQERRQQQQQLVAAAVVLVGAVWVGRPPCSNSSSSSCKRVLLRVQGL
jgi:hypothetical protein